MMDFFRANSRWIAGGIALLFVLSLLLPMIF
jgi:hypothetical protein